MDINLLFKIAAIGILVAVLHQVLVRAGREDQAMMTTLAGLVIVLTMVIKEISTLFDTVRTIFNLWDSRGQVSKVSCFCQYLSIIQNYIFFDIWDELFETCPLKSQRGRRNGSY